jgi:DNA-binding transcriptional LysR family regulator
LPTPAAKTQPPFESHFRWDDLRFILALAREKSLKGAARALGVNATTVGRRLESFEESVDAHLFDRTPDGVLPTAALELLLPQALEVELAAAEFARALAGLEREPEGLVRITAPPGIAQLFLAPALAEFHERFPRIRIELDASIGYADLTRREADIALRAVRPESGDLVAVKLGTAGSTMLASPKYAAELGKLADPARARFIDYGRELSGLRSSQWIATNVGPSAVVFRSNDMRSQLEAAQRGLGVVINSLIVAEPARLVEVELAPKVRRSLDAIPQDALWLVGHRALRQVPRIAAVWDFLVELHHRILPAKGRSKGRK